MVAAVGIAEGDGPNEGGWIPSPMPWFGNAGELGTDADPFIDGGAKFGDVE